MHDRVNNEVNALEGELVGPEAMQSQRILRAPRSVAAARGSA